LYPGRSKVFFIILNAQNGSGDHPAFYSIDTVFFPWVKWRGLKLTTHLAEVNN
jgi:hypothetical protein